MQEKSKKKGLGVPKCLKKIGSKITTNAQEKIDDVRFAKPKELTEHEQTCDCLGCDKKRTDYPKLLEAHEEHVARKEARKGNK